MFWKISPILFLLSCYPSHGPVKTPPSLTQVIYGKDHRQEHSQVSTSWQRKSHSVAAQIHRHHLSLQGDVYKLAHVPKWDVPIPYCPDEKFYGQPRIARCSGFLIASDKILTAGHCLPSCPHFVWVFDYNTNDADFSIPSDSVYTCTRSETFSPSPQFPQGFGLIHLDRPVLHRQPLAWRESGTIKNKEKVVLMGHPMGLPLKVDLGPNKRGNKLKKNAHLHYFIANLDSFIGNSGSPVLNAQSGLVEGVAIGGEEDFVYNDEKNCYQSKRCSRNTCQGESVLRILSLLNDEKFQSAHNAHTP